MIGVIIFEDGGSHVIREAGVLTVWRLGPLREDSSYPDNADGLSLAKARTRYLAGKRGKDCLS
jgi:hypothetical protein